MAMVITGLQQLVLTIYNNQGHVSGQEEGFNTFQWGPSEPGFGASGAGIIMRSGADMALTIIDYQLHYKAFGGFMLYLWEENI